MMFNMPMFTPPFYRRYPPPHYTMPIKYPHSHSKPSTMNQNLLSNKSVIKKESPKKLECSDENSQVFNILGITLHFDDILILCLLFFLYSEGVQDELLYIALILLLLG